jgi:hypothetical protein
MRRAPAMLSFCFAFAGAQVFAADLPTSAHVSPRRQLADCMTKRMYSDRTLSYNDAAKACKNELQGSKTDAALSKSSKPVS